MKPPVDILTIGRTMIEIKGGFIMLDCLGQNFLNNLLVSLLRLVKGL